MSRFIVGATWDDCGHLTHDAKEALWNSIPPYQREARSKGIPQLGAGAIYPFSESEVRVAPFEIPAHYPRAFGFDTALAGTTAAVWSALNRDTDVLYIYDVYKRSHADTPTHAAAWKGRGMWIPGAGDAAGVVDADRTQFIQRYRDAGFDVSLPIKAVEEGITAVYDRLSSGKLKVFSSCEAWFSEFRVYKRDGKGRVVKQNDHLMDATRYLIKSGIQRARVQPVQEKDQLRMYSEGHRTGWMGG